MRVRRSERAVIACPTLLLPEFSGAVARQTGRNSVVVDTLDRLRAIPDVQLHDLDDKMATYAAELAKELRIRGADAVYTALASRLGFRLVTWDIELRDRARRRVDAFTPADLLAEKRG